MRRFTNCLLSVALLLASLTSKAADLTSDPNWWKNAVIYEVYPRSFGDSNGDGIGDLNGITAHLDYLKDLGVDAIWIAPFFPSPLVDFGYDVSDYRAIDPQFGTMADFDRLVTEAKKRGMGIVGDMVLNHTSDKHPWFVESKSSRNNAKADWYMWNDGKNGKPPNNWISLFGGSAWELVPARKQFYYHRFYKEQPDLNWRNAQVREAMYDVCRFWLQKGMVGIRLDALTSIFEEEALKDEPLTGSTNEFGDKAVKTIYTDSYGDIHQVLRELRKVSDEFPGRVLIGETYVKTIGDLLLLYGKQNELQLPMDTQLGFENKLSANRFRALLDEGENKLGGNTPLFVTENHDNSRSLNRYGDGTHNPALAKLLATILLTPRDSALLYYGQEIGMIDHEPSSKDQVQDPKGRRSWPKDKGRDGERTPMPWNSGPQAGFSKNAKTWLPVGNDYKTINVASQENKPDSILNYYKALIRLKKSNPALRNGKYVAIDTSNSSVLSFLRKGGDGNTVLVSANLTKSPQTVSLSLLTNGITSTKAQSLISSFEIGDRNVNLKDIKLPAYGTLVAQIE